MELTRVPATVTFLAISGAPTTKSVETLENLVGLAPDVLDFVLFCLIFRHMKTTPPAIHTGNPQTLCDGNLHTW